MPYYNAGTRVTPSRSPEVSSRPATCCDPGTGKPPPRTWTVDQGGRSGSGQSPELPCQVCAVGQRCVSPICLFCAPSTPDVGGWFWLSSRVPRRDDQAAGEVSLTLAQQIHGMPLWRARGAGLGRVLRDVRPPGEDQWGWTRTADARAFKMADACCGDLRQWGDNVGWVGMWSW